MALSLLRRLPGHTYPRQFWLMFYGMLISTIGSSMIWPFLMIYASERLEKPLTVVASLMTISATMGLISSFIAGPIIDRFGRKGVMVFSLFANSLGYLLLSQATSFPAFAAVMALQGAVNPLFRVGGDAMMADLVPPEHRVDAYSLLRMSNNLGIAIGPAIGGFIAASSYNAAFYCAAAGLAFYGLLLTFLARETLPARAALSGDETAQAVRERFGGYGRVLHDRPYISFIAAMLFTTICVAVMWVLLSVYVKTNYGISESQYGFIPMTNALMVVLLQIPITAVTKRYPPLNAMFFGALLYAMGVSSIALGSGFWGFWVSIIVITFGELILAPTSSTYAANRAPADMRGRYMSVYGLTWGISTGIGPVFGGFLNDTLGPHTIWLGAGLVGMLAVFLFGWLSIRSKQTAPQPAR